MNLTQAAQDMLAERQRQDEKWGGAEHDDHHTVTQWVELIQDYAGWARVMAGMDSHDKARRRLIQVSALALAAAEALDRTCGVDAPADADSYEEPPWPIAKLAIQDGKVTASLYAPGLPDGQFDVFLEPPDGVASSDGGKKNG